MSLNFFWTFRVEFEVMSQIHVSGSLTYHSGHSLTCNFFCGILRINSRYMQECYTAKFREISEGLGKGKILENQNLALSANKPMGSIIATFPTITHRCEGCGDKPIKIQVDGYHHELLHEATIMLSKRLLMEFMLEFMYSESLFKLWRLLVVEELLHI